MNQRHAADLTPGFDLDTLRGGLRDYANTRLVDAFIGRGEHVQAGSQAQNAQRITALVLPFTDQNANVGVGESRLKASRLKGAGKTVEYVEFKGLDHQLDDDDARATLLGRSDQFLRKALGLAG